MYELIQISDHDYYIDCPAKIGVVRISDSDVVIIDSGSDKDAGKKVLKALDEHAWHLVSIFNTHSHADHIGGNKLIEERTGCSIYANGLEQVYTVNPVLESMGLYGGLPFKDIQNKFLMAQESHAKPLTEDVLPLGWKLINLPGHCFDMVGFITADGNAFIADSVSSKETLEKYGMAYLWDPSASLESLELLKTLDAKNFVPAHAGVCQDITELADINIESINKTFAAIEECCSKPCAFEDILKYLFDRFNMTLTTQQYLLIGSTLRSYLSAMYTKGTLTISFEDNKMLWTKA